MKIWTYLEASTKIITDLDLQDETFISPNELVGYFNEALTEAESEITATNQDYLLTKYPLPVVAGTSQYILPANIFANKIRGIMYANGSIIYPVMQYRRGNKFENLAFTDQYGAADDYRYHLINDQPGQAIVEIHPTLRETAIMPPSASAFTPLMLWFTRNCARIPYTASPTGEFCNPELLNTLTQVNLSSSNNIQTYAGQTSTGNYVQGISGGFPGSIPYVTGDQVQFQVYPGGVLPGGISVGVTYFVIAGNFGLIQLASTLANATANVPITITGQGSGGIIMRVAATTAIQNATLIDIPEFVTFLMQWARCRCMEKEGDPRLPAAAQTLLELKNQMVDTLTRAIVDDDDTIQPDMSFYLQFN